MDFSSKPDCLLFAARALASAHYCIKSGKYDASSVQNAKRVAATCEPIISNNGMGLVIDDGISGVSTEVIWPSGDRTPLPNDEPRYWADHFSPVNWDRSELKRDLGKALQLLQ